MGISGWLSSASLDQSGSADGERTQPRLVVTMTQFRSFASLITLCLALSASGAAADTIGSPLVQRETRDYNIGGLFVYDLQLGPVGSRVVEWGFYSHGATNGVQGSTGAGNAITPLLFEHLGGYQFQIVGVGTTRTNANTGAQRFDFQLVDGSAVVGANTYFGWRDGDSGGAQLNDGSIELNYDKGPGLFYYPTNAPTRLEGPIGLGATFSFTQASTQDRTYSVQVTTVPDGGATLLLLGLGLAGLGSLKRQRG